MRDYVTKEISRKGTSHLRNEDRAQIIVQSNRIWLGVFDGISSGGGGDKAAELSQKAMKNVIEMDDKDSSIESIAKKIFIQAQEDIQRVQSEEIQNNNIGSTAIVTCIDTTTSALYSFSIGDSALFLCSEKKFEKLTIEDSRNGYLICRGKITSKDASRMPAGNALDWYMGKHVEPQELWSHVHKKRTPVSSKDIIFLCSDGLYSVFNRPKEIAVELRKNLELDHILHKLLEMAIKKGSEDDITIVCAKPKPIEAGSPKQIPLKTAIAIAVFSMVLGFFCGAILSNSLKEYPIDLRPLIIEEEIQETNPTDTLNIKDYEEN